jgi:drug/metabolite transporter (DMT)-like permease
MTKDTARSSANLALATLYVLSGSTYLGIKFALNSIPPFLMGATRFLIAGVLVYFVLRATGKANPT